MNASAVAQAGTKTGRKIGGVVGLNLGSYTAELGGKVQSQVCKESTTEQKH